MYQKILFILFPLSLNAINIGSIDITSNQGKQDQSSSEASTIDVIDRSKAQTYSVATLNDVATLVPNLNISGIGNRSNKTLTVRGVSNYITYASSVAMYVDGIPLPFSYGYGLLDMNSMHSIEFSKGANGALFGKGAQSGVMKFYTQPPTKETKAKLSFERGSYNYQALYAYLSGATPYQYLNYSLSFNKESSDGYSTNTMTGNNFDSQEMYALHAKLHFSPSDDFDLALNYSKIKSDDGGSPFSINTKSNIRLIDNEPMDEYSVLQSDRLGLIINYTKGNYSLKSSTSYVKQVMDGGDYIAVLEGLSVFTDTTIEEFTQDLQLKRSFENSDLTLGLFYSNKMKFDYKQNQILWNLYPMVLVSKNSLQDPDDVLALSTEYNYYLDDTFILTAGLRYQESRRNFERTMNNFGADATYATASNVWKNFLPLLSLSYIAQDQSLFYLTYSKGVRTGGYNYRSADTLTPYKEEIVTSYELGYKNNFANTLTLNSVLFYNAIKDMRVITFSDTLVNSLFNADKAYSYGAELDMRYQQEDILLYGSLGVTQAKYNTLIVDEVDYSEQYVLDTPQATASLGLRYTLSESLYLNASLSYMGKRYYNIENTAVEEGYSVSNLALEYKYKNWEFELYGKNIFDNEYVDFLIHTPSNNYYHFGAPRVVGFRVSKNF